MDCLTSTRQSTTLHNHAYSHRQPRRPARHVINQALAELIDQGNLTSTSDIDAVGFKTVLGKDLSGCVDADDQVITALEGFREVAPAHNPPYAEGIRQSGLQLQALGLRRPRKPQLL